jgi:hypothetical protein
MISPRSHLTLIRPTLEQRLDAEGIPRLPRAGILPGLRLPPGTEGELVPLRCPDCRRPRRLVLLWPRQHDRVQLRVGGAR